MEESTNAIGAVLKFVAGLVAPEDEEGTAFLRARGGRMGGRGGVGGDFLPSRAVTDFLLLLCSPVGNLYAVRKKGSYSPFVSCCSRHSAAAPHAVCTPCARRVHAVCVT